MAKNEINYTTIFVKNYWNYYIELEKQLSDIRRYVDFSNKNNNVFSIEFLKLLQAVCSEIDVLAKFIDKYVYPEFNGGGIAKWGYFLKQIFPDISSQIVIFNDDYEVQPWAKWDLEKNTKNKKNCTYRLKNNCKHPIWWTAYNKAKHERTSLYDKTNTNYTRANLRNVVSAFAALFILENLCFEYISKKENVDIKRLQSSLFVNKNCDDEK